jgi:DNA-directed RNA polymerase specialized sigma24 family protein
MASRNRPGVPVLVLDEDAERGEAMGHEERVRELYDGCYRRLVGQLFAFCGDVSEAEDAVHRDVVRMSTDRGAHWTTVELR